MIFSLISLPSFFRYFAPLKSPLALCNFVNIPFGVEKRVFGCILDYSHLGIILNEIVWVYY